MSDAWGVIPPPEKRDPLRNPAVAINYPCDYCGAQPGEVCTNTHSGGPMTLPHYSRTPVPAAEDKPP